jgi:hypothetical protein
VQDRDRPARLGLPSEEAVEQKARAGRGLAVLGGRDALELAVVGRRAVAAPVTDPVQAQVGRDAVEQARGEARVQPVAPLQHPDEHVLTGVHGLVLVP